MKKTIRRILAFTLAFTMLFGISVFAADRNDAKAAFDQVNEIRVQNGLAPLTWNDEIEEAADIRAAECEVKFSHTRPDGSSWYTANSDLLYGENLAKGYSDSDSVVNAWMNSKAHKDNILSDEFSSGAISVYEENGVVYWAEEFGL